MRAACTAEMRRVEEVTSLDGYDAVVLGSSVYAGHWLRRARVFVDTFEAELVAAAAVALLERARR